MGTFNSHHSTTPFPFFWHCASYSEEMRHESVQPVQIMSIEETKIIEFLSVRSNLFVSVMEISRFLDRKKFETDRAWARAVLRRMEMNGLLEANPFGEYRVKNMDTDTKLFKQALGQPGAKLGDTTIITLQEDGESSDTTSVFLNAAHAVAGQC